MVKKSKLILSLVCCLMLFASLVFIGVSASVKNSTAVNFSFTYQQGVYAKVHVATSDATNNSANNYFYAGDNISYSIKKGDTFVDISQSLFFDSYSQEYKAGEKIDTKKSIFGAKCSDFGVYKLYIWIQNFSNQAVWSDFKLTYTDQGEEKDLNQSGKLHYEINNITVSGCQDNTMAAHNGVQLRIITITAYQSIIDPLEFSVETILAFNYTYIQDASGATCFSVDGTFNQNTAIEMEVGESSLSNLNNQALFGYENGNKSYYAGIKSNTPYLKFGETSITSNSWNTTSNKNIISVNYSSPIFNFKINTGNVSAQSNTLPDASSTPSATNKFYILGIANNNSSTTGYEKNFTGTFYRFKIFNGTTLTHDYIPTTDYTGKICLYDKVTKTFLQAQGSSSSLIIG